MSYTPQTLQKCITFKDTQMILLWLLKICNSLRVSKNSKDLHIHFCSLSLAREAREAREAKEARKAEEATKAEEAKAEEARKAAEEAKKAE